MFQFDRLSIVGCNCGPDVIGGTDHHAAEPPPNPPDAATLLDIALARLRCPGSGPGMGQRSEVSGGGPVRPPHLFAQSVMRPCVRFRRPRLEKSRYLG